MKLARTVRGSLLAAAASAVGGCGLVSSYAPPDWGWFDVVGHPTGGIPATLGYYGGVTLWSPFGYVLAGILPEPVDEPIGREPGHVLGSAVGLAVGAPFHLIALPFEGGGTPPDAAAAPKDGEKAEEPRR